MLRSLLNRVDRKILTCNKLSRVVFCSHRKGSLSPADQFRRKYQELLTMEADLPAPSSSMVLSVVGCGGSEPKGVMLRTDYQGYLFNCAEGCSRSLNFSGSGLKKLSHILMTHVSWPNSCGLLGTVLTLQQQQQLAGNKKEVFFHGSGRLNEIVVRSRGFAQLDSKMTVTTLPRDDGPFKDRDVSISYVPLEKNYGKEDSDEDSPSASKRPRYSFPVDNDVTLYICELPPLPRKIDLDKCVRVGIKKGPLIGQLKKGENVTLPDGKVVTPEEVLHEAQPPPKPLIVLECPSMEYIKCLNEHPDLQSLFADNSGESNVSLVVHLTPPDIAIEVEYLKWMSRFGPKAKHLMVNEYVQSKSMVGQYGLQSKFNLIHPELFPMLQEKTVAYVDARPLAERCFSLNNLDVTFAESSLQYYWRHSTQEGQFAWDKCPVIEPETFKKEALDDPAFVESLEATKEKFASLGELEGPDYPEIVFLGTASASPSKYRNVSGILVHSSPDQSFLLDCGEGTYSQLQRHYGYEELMPILLKLDMIYISHLHPDHHMGVFSILLEREKAFKLAGLEYKPIYILVSQYYENWFKLVENILGVPVSRLAKHEIVENYQASYLGRQDDILVENLNMTLIQSVHVHHSQFPFGVVLKHRDGWKLVYSGDTTPCQDLAQQGKNCDILIHEATFSEGLEKDAKIKKHSTLTQALDIAKEMNAKFTILTHFSQRYHKVPVVPADRSVESGIAFDHLRISHKQLPLLPHVLPCIEALFAEELIMSQKKVALRRDRDLTSNSEENNKHKKRPRGKQNEKREQKLSAKDLALRAASS